MALHHPHILVLHYCCTTAQGCTHAAKLFCLAVGMFHEDHCYDAASKTWQGLKLAHETSCMVVNCLHMLAIPYSCNASPGIYSPVCSCLCTTQHALKHCARRSARNKPAACPQPVSLVQETRMPQASYGDFSDGLSLSDLLWMRCSFGRLGLPFLLCAQLSYASWLQYPYSALFPLQTQHHSFLIKAKANECCPEVVALRAAAR